MSNAVPDQGEKVLIITIITLVIGGLFVSARLITRTIIKPQFGWGDGLILGTWFVVLGYAVAMFVSISHGYGKHDYDLSKEQYTAAVEASTVGQFLAIYSFPTGKAAVAVLLLSLFPGRKLKWLLWTLVVGNAIFFYVDGILILIQCNPVAYQWNQSISGGYCWSPKVVTDYGFFTGVFGAITDFTMASVPWFYIYKLQMGLKEKITVGLVLSLGYLAFAASCLKIYFTWELDGHTDTTWDTVGLVIWSSVELACINVTACMPTLRPLYLALVGKNPVGTRKPGNSSRSMRYSITHHSFFKWFSGSPRHHDKSNRCDNGIYYSRSFDVRTNSRESEYSGGEARDSAMLFTGNRQSVRGQ